MRSFIAIPNCSAVLATPTTILTAAHCIHDFSRTGKILGSYAPGRTFEIGNGLTNERPLSVTIKSSHVHPTWERACTATRPCDPNRAGAGNDPAVSDIAVLILTEPLHAIPAANLDLAAVLPGESIEIAGYGCEAGIGIGRSGYRNSMLTTVADGKSALAHPGSQRGNAIDDTLSANFVTPGREDGGPSLCPGDSGGPVYRALNAEEKARLGRGEEVRQSLVGLNVDYTFSGPYEEQGAIAKTNIHARFDAPTVKTWLADLIGAVPKPPQNGDLFLALSPKEDAAGTQSDSYQLYVSALSLADHIEWCAGRLNACPTGQSQGFELRQTIGERKFFKTTSAATLTAGIFTLIALDPQNRPVSIRHLEAKRR